MKIQKYRYKVPTRFARPARFEAGPDRPVPFRATGEVEFERLKDSLLPQFIGATDDAELTTALVLAFNEASALAWTTPFPALFLPGLLEEKSLETRLRVERQKRVRSRSRALFARAA